MTRRKSHPWVQPMFSYSDVLVLSTADGDAGAEGREEGSVWLYAHQLAALNSTRVHPRTLPPVVTPRYTENKPSSETSTHARRFSSQRIYKIGTLFYFLSYHCWVKLSWKSCIIREVAYLGTTFIPLMFYIMKHMPVKLVWLSLLW